MGCEGGVKESNKNQHTFFLLSARMPAMTSLSRFSYRPYVAEHSTGSIVLAVQTPELHLVQALRKEHLISPLQSVSTSPP